VTPAIGASRWRPAPPSARVRNLVFGAIGVTLVLGWIGTALWGELVDRHPLTMILLNAKPGYLVLTSRRLDPLSFYGVGTVRLLVSKPLVWLLGAWYGERAVDWAVGRSERGGRLIRWVQARFDRWGWAVIAVTSNNVVCLLAGAGGFSLGWFLALAAVSTLIRLWIFRQLGDVFSEAIDDLLAWVADHRPLVVGVSIALVLTGVLVQHLRGRGALDELVDLEHAVEDPDPTA